MCLQVGRMGPVSDDGPRQNNSVRSEGPWGRAALAARTAVLQRATFPGTVREFNGGSGEYEGRRQTERRARLAVDGKALSEMLALKPERGKPAFRNFREGDGNGGIIRSPLRAIALPDKPEKTPDSVEKVRNRRTRVLLEPDLFFDLVAGLV